MSADGKVLERLARGAISGKGSHVETKDVFSGLDWQAAASKPHGAAHSAYQLLRHMCYWQDWVVTWLEGRKPPTPRGTRPEAGLVKSVLHAGGIQ